MEPPELIVKALVMVGAVVNVIVPLVLIGVEIEEKVIGAEPLMVRLPVEVNVPPVKIIEPLLVIVPLILGEFPPVNLPLLTRVAAAVVKFKPILLQPRESPLLIVRLEILETELDIVTRLLIVATTAEPVG